MLSHTICIYFVTGLFCRYAMPYLLVAHRIISVFRVTHIVHPFIVTTLVYVEFFLYVEDHCNSGIVIVDMHSLKA